ncbi:FGGY family carbohydrate kinase [Vibrio hannami]|uniref:xylulokinase n=1 Tax=Vibrio hannami TaxID=2717094 RepID=UPI00241017D8|nr:FGGY family carbohydrate kinase [Vibrio hannami]MDG3085349.1 FGGY family carbohydrate kinase [Vibrio hannami]
MKDIVLAIDIGTGSTRAALVSSSAEIIDIVQTEYDQFSPKVGWSEQQPSEWWLSTLMCINELFNKHPDMAKRIAVVSACGQMHGTVLLDVNGELVVDTAILWNDKRAEDITERFKAEFASEELVEVVNNPPTSAWPAFKLKWIKENQPEVWSKVDKVLMPKDYINYRLTGVCATDLSEASCFYLMNSTDKSYDTHMLNLFGFSEGMFPEIRSASDIIGSTTAEVEAVTSLPEGTPVIAGTADMAATLLGSGVYKPGQASDSTGTSTLLTLVSDRPSSNLHMNNLHLANEKWGTFSILDAGGDAMRWVRLVLKDNQVSYPELAKQAQNAPIGSNALMFLPYLTGERNSEKCNSKAQWFGLSRMHRIGDIYRSVMEGVAFAAKRNLDAMKTSEKISQIIASGGGAKDDFWLRIKASVYNVPIVKTKGDENGILGCAMLGCLAIGAYDDLDKTVEKFVLVDKVINPVPEWVEYYERAYVLYNQLYKSSQQYYDQLDDLTGVSIQ